MKITGLITEYNPFHTGHLYHINKSRELTGADYIVVIMSGDFVQRGAPAIMPKHLRAKIALDAGADLVLELPAYFASSSAEAFAFGGVSILNSLGVVDSLCFGSESNNINDMRIIASVLSDEPKEYREILRERLKSGDSFPLARETAVIKYLKNDNITGVINRPNNILGIEYIKAILKLKSNITPYSIKRINSEYHDEIPGEVYSSATALRNILTVKGGFGNISKGISPYITKTAYDLMQESFNVRYPIVSNDFSLLLKHRLLGTSKNDLCEYLDVHEFLANRIYNNLNSFISFTQFCELLKTKEMTYTGISRALIHILLNIKTKDYKSESVDVNTYARVLGFRKESSELLTAISSNSTIPIITKPGKATGLTSYGEKLLNLDIHSSNLYESVVTDKFGTPYVNEYQKSIVF